MHNPRIIKEEWSHEEHKHLQSAVWLDHMYWPASTRRVRSRHVRVIVRERFEESYISFAAERSCFQSSMIIYNYLCQRNIHVYVLLDFPWGLFTQKVNKRQQKQLESTLTGSPATSPSASWELWSWNCWVAVSFYMSLMLISKHHPGQTAVTAQRLDVFDFPSNQTAQRQHSVRLVPEDFPLLVLLFWILQNNNNEFDWTPPGCVLSLGARWLCHHGRGWAPACCRTCSQMNPGAGLTRRRHHKVFSTAVLVNSWT